MEEQIKNNEIPISSVAQFVGEVTKIGINEHGIRQHYVYFRGEADETWETKAWLLRNDLCCNDSKDVDVYVQMEYQLINDAEMYNPSLFVSCRNSIDRLVEMQHYGLPTRLLDVTSNPLIALYFACEKEPKKAGKVLFLRKKPLDYYLANILASLCEYWPDYKDVGLEYKQSKGIAEDSPIYEQNEHPNVEYLLNLLENYSLLKKEDRDNARFFLFKYLTQSFLYIPSYTNERIKAQKGAFIFSAFMQPFLKECEYHRLRNVNRKPTATEINNISFCKTSVSVRDMFEDKYFVIPKDNKRQILKELDMLGINEAFVYPEPEHQMRTVKERVVMSNMTKEQFNS